MTDLAENHLETVQRTDGQRSDAQRTATRPLIEQLADNFATLMRSFVKARSHLLAAAAHDVEWSAHVILKVVGSGGPMRSSAIADAIQSDPSTVSRQVAVLVKDGLLERRADPQDGRAALLALTDDGRAVLADHNDVRLDHFADMLGTWTDEEIDQFAGLLVRFTTDYDKANEHWVNERVARGAARSGGKN